MGADDPLALEGRLLEDEGCKSDLMTVVGRTSRGILKPGLLRLIRV